MLDKDDRTGAIDVTFDPHDSKIVYAALWQARRQPWNFSSGGPGSGLYRSTDGGVDLDAAHGPRPARGAFSAASTSRFPAPTRSASTP